MELVCLEIVMTTLQYNRHCKAGDKGIQKTLETELGNFKK